MQRTVKEARCENHPHITDLVEAAMEDLSDLWTLKCHSLKVSFIVIVEKREGFPTICMYRDSVALLNNMGHDDHHHRLISLTNFL